MHHKHIQVMHQHHQRLKPILLIRVFHLLLLPVKTLYFRFEQKEQLNDRLGYLPSSLLLVEALLWAFKNGLELLLDIVLATFLDQP
jgi:hypothetical protein